MPSVLIHGKKYYFGQFMSLYRDSGTSKVFNTSKFSVDCASLF